MNRRYLFALASALAVAVFGVSLTAAPIVAEMKTKFFESWVEIIYDVSPGTTGDTVVAKFDGANTQVTLAGDIRVCDATNGCPTFGVATSNGELGVEGDIETDANLNVAGTSTLTGAVTMTAGLAGNLTLASGATIGQSSNNVVTITENSENVELTFGSNLCTIASTTGALLSVTPATTFADSITLSDGLIVDQTANNVLSVTENSEDVVATFGTDAVTFSSTTGVAEYNFTSIALQSSVVATHLETIRFCGNGHSGATPVFIGPVLLDDTEADLVFGGVGCDALDSTTETTADNPWHEAFAFKPVAMTCVIKCTGASAADDLVTFQLRDDTSGVTDITCQAQLAGDATPVQCTVRDPTPATVAANSAVAVSVSGVDDACNDAGDDVECLVYVTF